MLTKIINKLTVLKRQYYQELVICLILIMAMCFFFVFAALSNDTKQKEFPFKIILPAKIISVHDGDTIAVLFYTNANIRMLDCWAAEINSKDETEKNKGLQARDYLQTILKPEDEVLIEIPFNDKLSNSLTFGRILAKVYKDVDNDNKPDNISEVMVNKGFATKDKQNENNQ